MQGVEFIIIERVKPIKKGLIENFEARVRELCRYEHRFSNMNHALKIITDRVRDYNECWPDSELN